METKIKNKQNKEEIKVYITIDDLGIDGFGFEENSRMFRKIRAAANNFRGMQYIELIINKGMKEEMIKMAEEGKYDVLGELVKVYMDENPELIIEVR